MNEDSPMPAVLLAVAVSGAAIAFFLTPVMRFAPLWLTVPAGIAAGVGLAIWFLGFDLGFPAKWEKLWFAIHLAGVTGLIIAFKFMVDDANANDRRCAVLQADMLSEKPKRSDSRDLFTTLQCRPQGDALPQFSKLSSPPAKAGDGS